MTVNGPWIDFNKLFWVLLGASAPHRSIDTVGYGGEGCMHARFSICLDSSLVSVILVTRSLDALVQ